MKKYSNTRFFIEYVLIAFSTYLILSLVIAIIGGYSYRDVLTSQYQMAGLVLLYWWTPLPRMADLENQEYE